MTNQDLKLVYVLKIGYNSKKEGLYEFIFSKDPSAIDTEEIGWGESPAAYNAEPPKPKNIEKILSLTTKKIDLKCLHQATDRPYMDGYYTIHCLAHEDLDSENADLMYDELPLLVFHFGMTKEKVEDYLYSRDIRFKEIDVEDSQAATETEEEEEVDQD